MYFGDNNGNTQSNGISQKKELAVRPIGLFLFAVIFSGILVPGCRNGEPTQVQVNPMAQIFRETLDKQHN